MSIAEQADIGDVESWLCSCREAIQLKTNPVGEGDGEGLEKVAGGVTDRPPMPFQGDSGWHLVVFEHGGAWKGLVSPGVAAQSLVFPQSSPAPNGGLMAKCPSGSPLLIQGRWWHLELRAPKNPTEMSPSQHGGCLGRQILATPKYPWDRLLCDGRQLPWKPPSNEKKKRERERKKKNEI